MSDIIINRVSDEEFHDVFNNALENRRSTIIFAWYDSTVSNVFNDLARMFNTEITEVSLDEFTRELSIMGDLLARATGKLAPSEFVVIGIAHMRDGTVITYANNYFMVVYGRNENESYLAYASNSDRYVLKTNQPTNILITD